MPNLVSALDACDLAVLKEHTIADMDARCRGGFLGSVMLSKHGYRPRKMGPTIKAYEGGDTLMHLAARNAHGQPRFIAELIALGASTEIRNNDGDTPEDLDREKMTAAREALELRERTPR